MDEKNNTISFFILITLLFGIIAYGGYILNPTGVEYQFPLSIVIFSGIIAIILIILKFFIKDNKNLKGD